MPAAVCADELTDQVVLALAPAAIDRFGAANAPAKPAGTAWLMENVELPQ